MISAKELRCGNRVQFAEKMQPHGAYGDPGPYMTVYGIVEQMKVAQSSILPGPPWEQIWLESFLGPVEPERLTGIPLTEEWLKRMGFIKGGTENDRNLFYASGAHSAIHSLSLSGGVMLHRAGNTMLLERHIEYVHQLQNLYFALTGEELNFTTV